MSEPARKLDTAAMLTKEEEPIPYRVDKLAADGYVTVLAGHGGEGKSLLGEALAIGVAYGSAPGGLRCEKGRALILDGENGERLITRRYKLAQGPPDGVAIYEATGLNIVRHAGWITETIRAEGAQFVVLDSLRTLAPEMAENDGDTVLPVTAALRGIARETQAAVWVTHHRPKHGTGYRGSSVLRDQVDALFVLGRDPQDPERRTRRYLHCDPARDGKMRFDVEPPERWLSIDVSSGLLSISEAEPYGSTDRTPTLRETFADQIVEVIGEGRLKRSDIARQMGLDPSDSTVGRALRVLVTDGVLGRDEGKAYGLSCHVTDHGDNLTNGQVATLPPTPEGGGNDKATVARKVVKGRSEERQ